MSGTTEYTVYIDESGDLGIGKGSRWFVITAVIVKNTDEADIRKVIAYIRRRLNLRVIHIKDIRDFNKKLFIVSQFKDLPFTVVNVIADTSILQLKDGIKTYNFLSRILLERVSWYLRDHNGRANVIFSSRNSKRDNDLTDYLNNMVINYSWNKVAPDTIKKVSTEKMEEWDLLQLADVCAASMFRSHEPDPLGFIYPCLMNNLKRHLYVYGDQVFKYGIKYYKDNMRPEPEFYEEHAPCDYFKKRKEPPERT